MDKCKKCENYPDGCTEPKQHSFYSFILFLRYFLPSSFLLDLLALNTTFLSLLINLHAFYYQDLLV